MPNPTPLSPAEARIEAAHELLGAEPMVLGAWKHRECPGCTLLVYESDTLAHARECASLLALAEAEGAK